MSVLWMRPIQVGAKRDRSTLVVLYLQGQFINYCYYFYYFFFRLHYAGHWIQLPSIAVFESRVVWPCWWWRCKEFSIRLPWSPSSWLMWLCSYNRYSLCFNSLAHVLVWWGINIAFSTKDNQAWRSMKFFLLQSVNMRYLLQCDCGRTIH